MSGEEERKRRDAYDRIKKRLKDYRYRSALLKAGAIVWAILLISSLFPVIPVYLAIALGLYSSGWSVALWFLCIAIFAVLFWIFQRLATKIEGRRGITLEERMYVPAYEALSFLREYVDPDHPILGSKLKALRRLQRISVLLGEVGFPNISILREETNQILWLGKNLRTRLIPSIKNRINGNDPSILESAHSSLVALVDYLSEPKLDGLVTLNKTMTSLPEITERNIFVDFWSTLLRRSNLRHIVVFSIVVLVSLLVAYIDYEIVGGSLHDAFTFGVGSLIALVTLYVTYLGLTARAR
jgi:hypothetical protein